MKIFELTMPKQITDAASILGNAGYRMLGKGYYGSVYYKEGDKSVLKLFGTSDEGYRAFVDIAMDNQFNPYFPRFSRGVVQINRHYSAIRTELLNPVDSHGSYEHEFLDHCKAFITGVPTEDDYLGDRYEMPIDEKLAREWLVKQPPALLNACQILKAAIKNRVALRLDLHSGNIMKRRNQIVIIDPFTYEI